MAERGNTQQETAPTVTTPPWLGNHQARVGMPARSANVVQRKAARPNTVGSNTVPLHTVQPKLTIGAPHDRYEREADRVATEVLRRNARPGEAPGGAVPVSRFDARLVSAASTAPVQRMCDECEEELQRKAAPVSGEASSGASLEGRLQAIGKGRPLPGEQRAFFEPRFGARFDRVRLHTGASADAAARAVGALAFTRGSDIVFRSGQYRPHTEPGRHLLAHELTHVLQQGAAETGPTSPLGEPSLPARSPRIQRQMGGYPPPSDPRPPPGTPPAPNATSCGRPSHCPPGFCDPFATEFEARMHKIDNWPWIRLGIAAAVDSRVLPLWDDHVAGGTSTQDLTSTFGGDFAISPTTISRTTFLIDALKRNLAASPPTVAVGSSVTEDIPTRIPTEVAALNDPASRDRMNFNIPADIAGNLAGDIGRDQLTCQSGKRPSPHNDERNVTGSAVVVRTAANTLLVQPTIEYEVKDTIDLCPGNCGTSLEQVATVPISQWEATGIAGDVPIEIRFNPLILPFVVTIP